MLRPLPRLLAAFLIVGQASAALANSYNQDANSCDLNDKTSLRSLCTNGAGLPNYGSTQDMIQSNPNIANMIVDAANKYGVDPKLALSVSAHEGAMSACAGSFSGVLGPMQLTGATGRANGMDRGILSENIEGGVITLRDAVKSCGGTSSIRCLADLYNGSTESQRRNWTNDVTRRYADLNSVDQASIPQGCSSQAVCTGPGDFFAPGGGTQLATSTPGPAGSDINVAAGQV
ncbi:transglycosylase SLT domain-containing protein (plasmid) [Rhizobium sp. CB3171]|uniref:transglycosylase SLT domain-containing protein n=1 Tax=Rhizobium sp. CB3171 TaxID=3039157 RepID=UPI0024B1BABD|nr:transglycosylase SLT domain-containing protein [Rhizobium sp. CB3171]WFU07192.1 transglycosylase SLT domain-containing protein [Rhizobium sp. CB3171]